MAEFDVHQQTELLREIKDELRQSRVVSQGHQVAAVGRPPNTFAQFQGFNDRVIAGEWASLGWANAYRSEFKSNVVGDIFGSTGLIRAPNIMTQLEYQSVSLDSLHNRMERYLGSIVAPLFMGRVNDLGREIFANSHKFAWAGDPGISTIGAGINFFRSNQLARQIQTAAVGDLRLSGNDYSNIVTTGLKSGQYDLVHTQEEFVSRTKEMARAVSNLTRALHLGVSEVTQSMGAMRQYGITDVADQRRTLMNIQASGQASGLSTGEAFKAWTAGAQLGSQIGVSAATSGALNVSNTVAIQNMVRNGLVPQYISALGGGPAGIAQSQTQAQLSFLTSNFGYYSLLGGASAPGKDVFSAFTSGVSEFGGTLGAILSSQTNKMAVMNLMEKNPELLRAVNRNATDTYIRQALGADIDLTSPLARDAAFAFARPTMGDAAAFAYSQENYTQAGRAASERARINAASAARYTQGKLDYDTWYINNTYPGRFQQAMVDVRRIPADLANSAVDWWSGNGESGWFDFTSPMLQRMRMRQMGAIPTDASREAIIREVVSHGLTTQPDQEPVVQFPLNANHASSGRLLAKAALATGAYATANRLSSDILGHTGGMAAGTIAAVITAVSSDRIIPVLENGYKSLFGTTLTSDDVLTYHGADARALQTFARAQQDSQSVTAERVREINGSMRSSVAYNRLRQFGPDTAITNPADIKAYQEAVSRAAQETGWTEAEVLASLKQSGFDRDVTIPGVGLLAKDEAFIRKYVATTVGPGGLLDGMKWASALAVDTPEGAETLRDFLRYSDDDEKGGAARAKLRRLNATTEDFRAIKRRFRLDGPEDGAARTAYRRLAGYLPSSLAERLPGHPTAIPGVSDANLETLDTFISRAASESAQGAEKAGLTYLKGVLVNQGAEAKDLNLILNVKQLMDDPKLRALVRQSDTIIGRGLSASVDIHAKELLTGDLTELSNKSGFSQSQLAQARKMVGEATPDKQDELTRKILQVNAILSGTDKATQREEKSDAAFLTAVNILNKLAAKLGVSLVK